MRRRQTLCNIDRSPAQRGFTLIELIAVVVILAVLAVAAMSSFYDVKTEARKTRAIAHTTHLKAAVNGVRQAWLVANGTTAMVNVPAYGSGIMDVNTLGWPVDTGGVTVSTNNPRCRAIFNGLLPNGVARARLRSVRLHRRLCGRPVAWPTLRIRTNSKRYPRPIHIGPLCHLLLLQHWSGHRR